MFVHVQVFYIQESMHTSVALEFRYHENAASVVDI